MDKLEFTTKLLTLKQRIEVNDLEVEMNAVTGSVIVRNMFAQRVKYLCYGLKSLGGIEITEDNFDEQINKLTNNEIEKISDKIAEETNLSKKKRSKSD